MSSNLTSPTIFLLRGKALLQKRSVLCVRKRVHSVHPIERGAPRTSARQTDGGHDSEAAPGSTPTSRGGVPARYCKFPPSSRGLFHFSLCLFLFPPSGAQRPSLVLRGNIVAWPRKDLVRIAALTREVGASSRPLTHRRNLSFSHLVESTSVRWSALGPHRNSGVIGFPSPWHCSHLWGQPCLGFTINQRHDMSKPVIPSEEKLLLTLDQAGARLNLSRRSLERLISDGRFPRPLKINSSSRILPDDVTAYIDKLKAER